MPRRPQEQALPAPGSPPADVPGALAALPRLGTAALCAEWQRLHGRPPPGGLTRDLLMRGVAHRWQELAFGGLSPAAARRLEASTSPTGAGRVRRAGGGRLKPGTVVVRGWRGRTHTVVVWEDGFEHEGRLDRSLSLVAREVTGAHWFGPRFFRLGGKAGPPPVGQG